MKTTARSPIAKVDSPASGRFSQPARPFSTSVAEEQTLVDVDAWLESAGRLGHNLANFSGPKGESSLADQSPMTTPGGVIQRAGGKKHHDPSKKKHLTKAIAQQQKEKAQGERRAKAEDQKINREKKEAAKAAKKAAKKK